MEAIGMTTGMGKAVKRGLAGFLMSLALLATTSPATRAAEASWSAAGVIGSGTLSDAATAVNTTAAGTSSTVSVDQNVAAPVGDGNSAAWLFGGTSGSNKDSLSFTGNGNTLTGNSGALMQVQYVDNAIGISNLTFRQGWITVNTGLLGNAAGAGLSLSNLGANAAVNLNTATFDSNRISLANPVATTVRGGGFSVVHSAVTGSSNLVGVNMNNNSVNVSYTALTAAEAFGGGGYIEKGSVTINGGSIANNSLALTNGSHAYGGGLALVDSSVVQLQGGLAVQGNGVSAGGDYPTRAMGGGVYYSKSDGLGGQLNVASGTAFTGNFASNTSTSTAATYTDYAAGGAVAVSGQAATNIGDASGDTTFTRNYATSTNSYAVGGAVAVTPYQNASGYNYAQGDVAIVNGVFDANYASGGGGAQGGAVYLGTPLSGYGGYGSYDVAITGGSYTKNYATSTGGAGDYAQGGAVYMNTMGTVTISGTAASKLVFSGNYASIDAFYGVASGGALYIGDGDASLAQATLTNVEITGNSAIAASGIAYGGGVYFGQGDNVIENSVISGNSAVANGLAGVQSAGGGIYAGAGVLTLRDSQITGNSVTNPYGDSYGSAIYMDTTNTTAAPGDVATINLEATAGNTTSISGNKQQGRTNTSGVYFGELAGSSANGIDAALNLTGAGDIELLNPVEVNMTSGRDFTMTKSSTGNLKWDGYNIFTATGGGATVDLNNGVIELGDDFTARAMGNTDFTVKLTDVSDLRFSLNRDADLALFDFSQVGSTNDKVFSVSNSSGKTNMTITVGREIKSFNRDYVIIAGMDEDEDMDSIAGKFRLRTDGYVTATYSALRTGEGSLVASVDFKSPFDDNTNSQAAQNALVSLVQGDWGKANISDAEYYGMLANARNVTPELAYEQAFVMLNAADRVTRDAIDHGLRSPHLARLKLGNSSIPATYYDGGYETVESYESYGDTEEYYEYESAYPSLVACDSRGLRVWAGYVGEWRNQDGHGGYNGYRMDRNGIIVGAAYDFGERAAVAVYGAYTASNTKAQNTDSAKVSSDVGHIGITGRFSPLIASPAFSFYGDAGYHWSSNDSHRNLGGWTANGSFDQDVVSLGVGVEHVFYLDRFNIRPFAEGRYYYIDQDGMTETGSSSTTMQVAGTDGSAFTSRLGVELSRDYLCNNWIVSPTFNVDWRHEFGNTRYSGVGIYTKDPTPIAFTVSSSRMPRDSGDVGASIRGAKNLGSSKLGFNLAYNLNFARNYHEHSVYAGMDLGF